jgi:membrane protein
LNPDQLSHALRVDPLQLEPVLDALSSLDWIGRVNEAEDRKVSRYVLLTDPSTTPLSPLVAKLLLLRSAATERFWDRSAVPALLVKDVL